MRLVIINDEPDGNGDTLEVKYYVVNLELYDLNVAYDYSSIMDQIRIIAKGIKKAR